MCYILVKHIETLAAVQFICHQLTPMLVRAIQVYVIKLRVNRVIDWINHFVFII